jgi:Bacterial PH domain
MLRHAFSTVVALVVGWGLATTLVAQSASLGRFASWFPGVAMSLYVVAVLLQFRTNMAGIAVGEPGVRIRTAWRTRIVPWPSIQRALVVEDPRYRNWMVVIDTHDGERIRTPIVRDGHRPLRSLGPAGHVTLYLSELKELARTLDAMAAARSGRVPA